MEHLWPAQTLSDKRSISFASAPFKPNSPHKVHIEKVKT